MIYPKLRAEDIDSREHMFKSKAENDVGELIKLPNVDINSKIAMLLCKFDGSALRFDSTKKQMGFHLTFEV